jgi:hypothetical protein
MLGTSKSTIVTRPSFQKVYSLGFGANGLGNGVCLIQDLLIRHSSPGVQAISPAFTGDREARPIEVPCLLG